MKENIEYKLKGTLFPTVLEVIDDSHKHVGHQGWKPNKPTHFSIIIASEKFQGKSRIEAHKLIYKILEEEIKSGIHALAIKIAST
jgi:BolA protein